MQRVQPPLSTTVQLTRGYEAFVSLVDRDLVRPYSWRAQIDNKDHLKVYAATEFRDGSRRRKLYMHRLITGAAEGMVVDHRNQDGIDNTRGNLRVVGYSANMQNASIVASLTGYRGVSRCGKKFRARMMFQGEEQELGRFVTAEDAARAYDKAALALFGPLAWTNFEVDRGELAEVYDLSDLPF